MTQQERFISAAALVQSINDKLTVAEVLAYATQIIELAGRERKKGIGAEAKPSRARRGKATTETGQTLN